MAVKKDHEQIKSADYKRRKTDHAAIRKNKVDENLMSARPVEDYVPKFKILLEQFPIEKRY
jgi:hypothetical protein